MATTTKLSADDISWVAGILDMKGLIIRKKNQQRKTPQLVLMVETKQFGVVRELSRLTGTSPELQERKETKDWMRKGCVEHCPERHVHVTDTDSVMPPIARWTTTGAAAAVVLWNTVPKMRTERGLREALSVMLDQTVVAGQGWGATRSAIRRLRDLGWPLPPPYQSLDLDG